MERTGNDDAREPQSDCGDGAGLPPDGCAFFWRFEERTLEILPDRRSSETATTEGVWLAVATPGSAGY